MRRDKSLSKPESIAVFLEECLAVSLGTSSHSPLERLRHYSQKDRAMNSIDLALLKEELVDLFNEDRSGLSLSKINLLTNLESLLKDFNEKTYYPLTTYRPDLRLILIYLMNPEPLRNFKLFLNREVLYRLSEKLDKETQVDFYKSFLEGKEIYELKELLLEKEPDAYDLEVALEEVLHFSDGHLKENLSKGLYDEVPITELRKITQSTPSKISQDLNLSLFIGMSYLEEENYIRSTRDYIDFHALISYLSNEVNNYTFRCRKGLFSEEKQRDLIKRIDGLIHIAKNKLKELTGTEDSENF